MIDGSGPLFIIGSSHSGKTPLRRLIELHPDVVLTRHVEWWHRHWGRLGDLRRPEQLRAAVRALCADPDVQRLAPDARLVLDEVERTEVRCYPRLFGAVHHVHARTLDRPRWGIQLRGLERRADAILDAFPAGRVVHLVRAGGARRAVGAGIASSARRRAGRRPGQYRIVDYRQFAADPAATLVQVCRFCELEATPTMVEAARRTSFDGWRTA